MRRFFYTLEFCTSNCYVIYSFSWNLLDISEENSRNESAVFYSLNQANLLTEHLSKKSLPGLSSQEQMSLLALSDTIASSKDVDIEGIELSESRKYRSG